MRKQIIGFTLIVVALLLVWWAFLGQNERQTEDVGSSTRRSESEYSALRTRDSIGEATNQQFGVQEDGQRSFGVVRKEIELFVFDETTKEALSGVLVEFHFGFNPRGNPIEEGKTDSQGLLQLEGIPPGLYTLDLTREGYHSKRVRSTIQSHLTYGRKTVGLFPEILVRGYVHNQYGTRIEGALVDLYPQVERNDSFSVLPSGIVRTNDKGFFETACIGGIHKLLVSRSGHKEHQHQVTVDSKDTTLLEITLEKLENTVLLTGMVVDERGRPLEGVGIRVKRLGIKDKEDFLAGQQCPRPGDRIIQARNLKFQAS